MRSATRPPRNENSIGTLNAAKVSPIWTMGTPISLSQRLQTASNPVSANSAVDDTTMIATTGRVSRARNGGRFAPSSAVLRTTFAPRLAQEDQIRSAAEIERDGGADDEDRIEGAQTVAAGRLVDQPAEDRSDDEAAELSRAEPAEGLLRCSSLVISATNACAAGTTQATPTPSIARKSVKSHGFMSS